jgi:hypothetical protein
VPSDLLPLEAILANAVHRLMPPSALPVMKAVHDPGSKNDSHKASGHGRQKVNQNIHIYLLSPEKEEGMRFPQTLLKYHFFLIARKSHRFFIVSTIQYAMIQTQAWPTA